MTTDETEGKTPDTEETRDDYHFLGREFLSWLTFHAESKGGNFSPRSVGKDLEDFGVAIGGKVTLRTPAGMLTDVTLKGPSPATSPDIRYLMAGGHAVREIQLRFEQGERSWVATLTSELDVKGVKLPALLEEEHDTRVDERLALLDRLNTLILVAFSEFLHLRRHKARWEQTLGEMREWLGEYLQAVG